MQAPLIVSASRSTDIPAFYADWFFHRLEKGYSAWTNPFNGAKEFGRSEYAIRCRLNKKGLEKPIGMDEMMKEYNKLFEKRGVVNKQEQK